MKILDWLFKPNVKKLQRKQDIHGLIKALRFKSDNLIRRDAAEALGMISNPIALDALVDVLEDQDGHVRLKSVRALGAIKDVRAVEALIRALTDKEDYVRWNAAEALGKVKDPRAIDPLVKALSDHSKLVRKDALSALKEFPDQKASDAVRHYEAATSSMQADEPLAAPQAGQAVRRLTHLLILIEAQPREGDEFFIGELIHSLHYNARPYAEFVDRQTKIRLNVVGQQNFRDESLLVALLYSTWGQEVRGKELYYQRFLGRGGTGSTVAVFR